MRPIRSSPSTDQVPPRGARRVPGRDADASGASTDTWVDRWIATPGGELAFTVAGSGQAVVLIHGLGGDRHTWRHLIGPLSRHRTVIALDLPGHGDSAAPAGGYSPGSHAAAVRDLMVALGIPRASLVGHSLGGGIAVQFAYQFPDRTERVALISSGGFGVEVTPLLRGARLPGAEALLSVVGRVPRFVTRSALAVAAVVSGLVARDDATPVSNDLRGMADPRRRHGFVSTARAVMDLRGQTALATPYLHALVDLPILLAWGSDDRVIPPSQHSELARTLPAHQVVEILGAGHYPHETAADQLLPPLERFLTATEPFQYADPSRARRFDEPAYSWEPESGAGHVPEGGPRRSSGQPQTATDALADSICSPISVSRLRPSA